MNIPCCGNAEPLSRAQWMRLLALAPEQLLDAFIRPVAQRTAYSFLRKPEAGLVMVEGQTGATRFNLGEMLVTRCTVRLQGEQECLGYAWVQGNKPEHATLAALGDAFMQLAEYNKPFTEQLFFVLQQKEQERKLAQEQEVAPTRVEFFTMVRGEG